MITLLILCFLSPHVCTQSLTSFEIPLERANQVSQYQNRAASLTIDGDKTTSSHSEYHAKPWLRVFFDQPYDLLILKEVSFLPYTYSPGSLVLYTVSTFLGETNTGTCGSVKGKATVGYEEDWLVVRCNGTSADSVEINVVHNSGFLVVAEVKVQGYKGMYLGYL